MKKLNKARSTFLMLVLGLFFLGCDSDDEGNTLPDVVAGFTFTVNSDTGAVTFINISENATSYEWNFGDESGSTEINPVNVYPSGVHKVSLEASNEAGASHTFEDEITVTLPDGGAMVMLPISFDDDAVNYTVTTFNGVAFSVVDNPDVSGSNATDSKVGSIINSGAEFEGFYYDLGSDIDLSTDKTISMNFWADAPVDVLVKLEEGAGDTPEVKTSHGGTGWETMSFTFSSANSYSRFTLFVDGPGMTDGTFYIDDIDQVTSTGNGTCTAETAESLNAANFNLTFQTDPTASIGSFDAGLTWVDNPDTNNQVNTSCKVGQIDRASTNPFANNQIELDAKLDFNGNAGFKMKVWSPTAGTNVLLKLEDQGNGGIFTQLSVATTKAGEWEELTFPFASSENGKYDLMILFFELDTNTAETYYIDDFALYNRIIITNPGANLVANGNFEDGANGWDNDAAGNSGSFEISNQMPACGAASANLMADSAQLYLISQSGIGAGALEANDEITISFDLRGTLAGAGGTFFAILLSQSSTESIGVTKTDILNNNQPIFANESWTRYEFTTTAGPDVTGGLILQLKVECGAVDGCISDAFIDNIYIAAGDAGGPECLVDNGNPSVGISNATVNEADGTATFEVSLSGGDAQGGFTVDYATVDGSAVQPADYTATSGTLTFAGTNGESQNIVVPIIDDAMEEPSENFTVNLSNTSVEIGTGQATGTINDNDGTTVELSENGGFESGNLDGWAVYTNNGSITADNTDPSVGAWSATLVATPTGQNPTLKQERKGAGTLSIGDIVEITFDYKGSLSGVGGVYSIQSFVEATNGVNQAENFSVTPTSTWQTFTQSYTVGQGMQNGDISGGITMEFVAICGADPGTNCISTLSVDNVSIVINP